MKAYCDVTQECGPKYIMSEVSFARALFDSFFVYLKSMNYHLRTVIRRIIAQGLIDNSFSNLIDYPLRLVWVRAYFKSFI